MTRWLARLRAFVSRLFRRAPAPGRFERGTKGSWHGFLSTAPLVMPRRDYLVYLPAGHSRWRRAPVLVLCHGCRQSPEEIAAGTRITEVADRRGIVVLLPRQKEAANPWRCWNWFDPRTAAGNGEAAILHAQVDAIVREFRADAGRVVVAGMSAGGALAAALALRYAASVRGVFVHSGLACGAASAPAAAMAVMSRGPDADVETIAREARRRWPHAGRVPLCVVQGEADSVVAPVNATALVRQYLALNAHPALVRAEASADALPPADAETQQTLDGRTIVTREWRAEGALVVRHVGISGLAHAWSGGDARLPFNDAAPPSATFLLERFAAEVLGLE